ncbi:DUF637 domain-containing protein [uncultured Shewanella sp.]|uniref:DUF637 domain-containing protein n=1 Tax=uncultured Shewanella sp. TaxID=173975 RepID=UPI002616B8B8|nr:DUF637 domain-containing protein [uncultured Shewanella sp.]
MKHTNQILVAHTSTTPEAPLWQKFTSWLLTFVMLFQITLPVTAQAANLISDSFIQSEVNANGQYERVSNSQYQFEKAYYVDDVTSQATQNIATFQQKLLDFRKSALPSPLMIPIINDGITMILPHYPLAKQIGDPFVQSRFIRSQIFNALNRNLISKIYATEKIQINALYNNAYTFSGTSSAKLGDKLTQAQVNSFGKNLIWPELRSINGEQVLVPVVHFTDDRLSALKAEGHTVEFLGDEAHFNSITVNAGTIFTNRNTFINTAGDFNVNQNAKVVSSGDLNLLVGGTLQILSGQLTAQDSVNIIADQYVQKTLVHRFATRFEQGTRLGTIASVNAINGNVSIRSYNDIVVQGGTIDGDNIVLNADGNIMLLSQRTSYVRNENIGGFDEITSIVSHTASRLSASDSIYLMASGIIQINASTLTADRGVLQILAQQGIYITNEFDEFQKNRQGTVGEVTLTEQEFQTIAIQSALEAGKGVLIASDFGDITLRATEITSGDGTNINAYNGAVNLLLAKEQDHYFMNRVTEGMWRIKTETQTDTVDTAVYNRIIGGVKVQATHGVTLELGQSEDVTLDEMMAQFEDSDSLSWMAELYHDPELSQNVELAYQELVNIHEYDKTSSLSPAAMAIIAIAMAVVMGPAGFAAIGASGGIAVTGFAGSAALTAALQAGALALATQTAMSLANGNNLIETTKAMHSSDTVRTVATAMATAGALNYIGSVGPFSAVEGAGEAARNMVDLGNQAAQLVVKSAVSTGISTVINGGNFDEFTDTFVQALQVNAVNQLGASLAEDIEFYSQHEVLDEVLEYIAHGAVGCLTGGLNSSDSSDGCAAGAAGSITATFVSKSFDHEVDTLTDKEKAVRQLLKDTLDLDPLVEADRLRLAQQEAWLLQNKVESADILHFKEWRDIGTRLAENRQLAENLSRLTAGLGVFIAGGSAEAINAADASASNTAQGSLWRQLEPVFKSALALNEIASDFDEKVQYAASGVSLNIYEIEANGMKLPKALREANLAPETVFSIPQVMVLTNIAAAESAIEAYTPDVTLDGGFDQAAYEVANGDMPAALDTLAEMSDTLNKANEDLIVTVDGQLKFLNKKLTDQLVASHTQLEKVITDAYFWGEAGERALDISGASGVATAGAALKFGAGLIAGIAKKSLNNEADTIAFFASSIRKTNEEVTAGLEEFADAGFKYYLDGLADHAGDITKQKRVIIDAIHELAELSSNYTKWLGNLEGLSVDELLYKFSTVAESLPLTTSMITQLDNFMLAASKKVDGSFLDDALEAQYQRYIVKKEAAHLDYRERNSYLQSLDGRGAMLRGTRFNQYANEQKWYPFSEVHIQLPGGERRVIDNLKEVKMGVYSVIERKSYDLGLRDPAHFAQLLDNEVINKYPSGATFKAAKYPDKKLYNTTLLVDGYVLELPEFNRQLSNIVEFEAIARQKGVELRFRPEPPVGWTPPVVID